MLFCLLLLLLLLRLQVLPLLRSCCGFGLLLCAAFECYSTLETNSQPNLAASLKLVPEHSATHHAIESKACIFVSPGDICHEWREGSSRR